MREFPLKTEESIEQNRVSLFVHFDFLFFPMRVHSGNGTIEWQSHKWEGIGGVLTEGASCSSSVFSSQSYNRGKMSASLPMSRKTRDILADGYYRNRRMEWQMCAMNKSGHPIDQIHFDRGVINEYSRKEDTIKFTAISDSLDSVHEKDTRHMKNVEAIRRQFKEDVIDTALSDGRGWLLNLFGTVSDLIGFVADILSKCARGSIRRSAIQRGHARKRTYWFETEPNIPGKRKRKNGYRVKADTLNEAKMKLYDAAVKRIWDFPRGYLQMVVYWNGRPLGFFDLDKVRQQTDPERFEETNPLRTWKMRKKVVDPKPPNIV